MTAWPPTPPSSAWSRNSPRLANWSLGWSTTGINIYADMCHKRVSSFGQLEEGPVFGRNLGGSHSPF